MKKFSFIKSALPVLLVLILLAPLTYASTSAKPTVDTVLTPVNASKATITGKSSAGAKIIVTGGPYEIAPIYANSSGKFSVTVALVQESTNLFHIQSQVTGSDPSDQVDVTIIESDAEAAAYETATGTDRTAPGAPTLDESSAETSASTYSITGTGEAKTTVIISGTNDATGTVDSTGQFSVKIALKGSGATDTFSVSLKDSAGNVSSSSKITVVSSATESGAEEEEEDSSNNVAYTVTATEFAFSPSTLSATVGQEVTITFKNSGSSSHNFVISELDVTSETITSGESTEVSFTPTSAGTYTYFCAISGHDEAGMHGTLTVSASDETDLSDISGHWAEEYIKKLYNKGIVGGYSDGTFGPDDSVTRAQILKMALLAFDHDLTNSDSNFSDVNSGAWYTDYVGYAQANDIVSGYSDGTFKPDNYVDRAGAIKIILLAAGKEIGTSTTPNFSDVSSTDWFSTYTAYAKANGIIGGYSDGTYKGGQNISRAEVAKILAVMIE